MVLTLVPHRQELNYALGAIIIMGFRSSQWSLFRTAAKFRCKETRSLSRASRKHWASGGNEDLNLDGIAGIILRRPMLKLIITCTQTNGLLDRDLHGELASQIGLNLSIFRQYVPKYSFDD